MVGQDAYYGNVSYEDDKTGNRSFTVTGVNTVMAKLDQYINDVPTIVYDELGVWAGQILKESQIEVPVDMTYETTVGKTGKLGKRLSGGTLKRSGTVQPYSEGDFVGYEIGYAAWNHDYNYAIIQHEDLTFHHTKPGAKAKYLEDPFNRIKGDIAPGIVTAIDSYFTQGIPSMSGMMKGTRSGLGNIGGRFI